MDGIFIVTLILFIISWIILTIGFLMSPYFNSFSGALVGSSDLELFSISKEKGYKKFLKYTMIFAGLTLMIVSILIRVFT